MLPNTKILWISSFVLLVLMLIPLVFQSNQLEDTFHLDISESDERFSLTDSVAALVDISGNTRVVQLKRNEKIYFHIFWEKCLPCIDKMKAFENSNLDIRNRYFVSREDIATIQRFAQRWRIDLPLFHLPKETEEKLHIKTRTYPSTYVCYGDSVYFFSGR